MTSGRAHRDSAQLRQKQGRDTHLERKGYEHPPKENECSKKAIFIRADSSRALFTFVWPIILLCCPHPPCPRILPGLYVLLLPKPDSSAESSGGAGLGVVYFGVASSLFGSQGTSLCMCSVSLVFPKDGEYVTFWSFTPKGFSPSVPAVTVMLKCSQETEPSYLSCFCCYFHLKVQTRGWL